MKPEAQPTGARDFLRRHRGHLPATRGSSALAVLVEP